ncbi:MAG: sugar transferase [Anaerolineae bacterium]|jgi:sugar transferase EpsL|nr:sugar transferase [Anaerolineae bacterium]MBT7074553.1 sugar transferase [Anaerolineae bacterium]MBT7783924.1 sugar transferase [Anaerolineae bacterium]
MQSKYIFDFLIALIGMIILAPLLLVLTFFVLLFHGMPILFKQERPGYKGRAFFIYKFRTMNNRSTADGSLLADSERLTRFGHFLRATSLDELPELFNILRGEMSLVGPRPLLMQYLPLYNEEQMRRHEMRPGITGWAQINGRNNISWDEKFKLDIWYVDNWSFWLDIKILWLTFAKVFKREDISMDGEVTTSFFEGN